MSRNGRPGGGGRLVAAALSVLLLAGCGGGEENISAGTSSSSLAPGLPAAGPTSTSALGPQAGATSTAATAEKPPGVSSTSRPATGGGGTATTTGGVEGGGGLRRRDVPPGGVAAQLGQPLVPTDGCGGRQAARSPVVEPNDPSIAVGGRLLVCARGFSGPVDVTVRLPDGSERSLTRQGPTNDGWFLKVAVLDPLGSSLVTARQGTATATASVQVTLPPAPVVESLVAIDGPPGTTFRFAVASPAPNQAVDLDVYDGQAGQAGRYVTTLVPARTDGSARVVYQLPTQPADPKGSYCVVPRQPSPDSLDCARFTVT